MAPAAGCASRSTVVREDDVDVLQTLGPDSQTAAAAEAPAGRSRVGLFVGVSAYAVTLLVLRPVTPFEWDEVLFMRSMARYDVAAHSPHPPGYPAFVGAGKIVNDIVADPQLALQLVSLGAAVVALVCLWRLVLVLGGSRTTAAGATFLLATMPGFLYAAGVGMSDVAGTAAGLAAVAACVTALKRAEYLPVAAAVVSLAAAVRPQVAAVALLLFVAACGRTLMMRRWRYVFGAAVSALLLSAAFWVPAIWATGWTRWLGAMKHQMWWIRVGEGGSHLPAASWRSLAEWWLAGSFVGWEFAVPMWSLVVVGLVVLLRKGRRDLVAVSLLASVPYLTLALRSMNMSLAIRYFLPVAPFVALLAAGGLEGGARWVRRLVAGTIVLWGLSAAAWSAPAMFARLRPEPVWAALSYIKNHFEPSSTRVVFAGEMTPHVEYVLQGAGFQVAKTGDVDVRDLDDGVATLAVTPLPIPGAELVFAAKTGSRRVAQLAARRYGTCTVTRLTYGETPVFSPAWQIGSGGWRLWGTGTISLAEGASPRVVSLRPGHAPLTVRRPGSAAVRLAPWQRAEFPLLPGRLGGLEVSAPANWLAAFEAPVIEPLTAGSDSALLSKGWVLPVESGGGRRTDVYVFNPNGQSLGLTAELIAERGTPREGCTATAILAPGEQRWFNDVIATLSCSKSGNAGVLVVRAEAGSGPAGFVAVGRARTGRGRAGDATSVPAIPLSAAIGPWQVASLAVGPATHQRARIDLVAPCRRAVLAEVELVGDSGRTIGRRLFHVSRLARTEIEIPALERGARLDVRLLEAPDDAALIPILILRGEQPGQTSFVLPEPGPPGSRQVAILPACEPSSQARSRPSA